MFKKPIQCNCFVYYGIIASEGELKSAMKRMNKKDLYAFIFGNGLSYQRVGNAKKSAKYLIGKEIFSKYAFTHMRLYFDENDNLSLTDQNNTPFTTKLSKNEELEISRKIYNLGFFNLPAYYMIHNYDFNEI